MRTRHFQKEARVKVSLQHRSCDGRPVPVVVHRKFAPCAFLDDLIEPVVQSKMRSKVLKRTNDLFGVTLDQINFEALMIESVNQILAAAACALKKFFQRTQSAL